MAKLRVSFSEEKSSFTVNQEGQRGFTFSEGYLSYLISGLTDTKTVHAYRGGQFGIECKPRSVILYVLDRGKQLDCVVMSHSQASKLAVALSKKYDHILNSYTKVRINDEGFL